MEGNNNKEDKTHSSAVPQNRLRSSRKRNRLQHVSSKTINENDHSNKKEKRWTWREMSLMWRKHYLDLGHCRLRKCTTRLRDASSVQLVELLAANASFMAMAVSAASAYGRTAKEEELLEYARVLVSRGCNPNDSYNGNSAVSLAAYHGFVKLLRYLLTPQHAVTTTITGDDHSHAASANPNNDHHHDSSSPPSFYHYCSLDSKGPYGHALMAATRNGQQKAVHAILTTRPMESCRILQEEQKNTSQTTSTLYHAICRRDVVIVRNLLFPNNDTITNTTNATTATATATATPTTFSSSSAMLSDLDCKNLDLHKKDKKSLETVFLGLYNYDEDHYSLINTMHSWNPLYHWSFPTTDRQTMNWLWYTMVGTNNPQTNRTNAVVVRLVPKEVWLVIFSFFGRGWFACRTYPFIGRPSSNIDPMNILS